MEKDTLKFDLSTVEGCTHFIEMNIPVAIRPVKKSKTTFVSPFRSYNAYAQVCSALGEKLHEYINVQPPVVDPQFDCDDCTHFPCTMQDIDENARMGYGACGDHSERRVS